ncbi:trypsin-1-like [Neodiprion virginianus]|uniref:trypsin-1-like n=1 Tax=Neodiprion virginianus TaxID=2961670 RepID=UPI001EE6B7BB|nr:trypsin-1-like [Neodiprion virginianus]
MFRLLTLLFALSAVAYGEKNESLGYDSGRIAGGSTASIKDFPYQLSMRWKNNHYCGASLISSKWAVSAAHCTFNRRTSELTLLAGTSNRLFGGQLRNVFLAINHPRYKAKSIDNDISLLKVSRAFTLSSTVQAIALPYQEQRVSANAYAVVSGWGTTREGTESAPVILQQVSVPLVASDTCNSLYFGRITSGMLCAGYLSGGYDACQGDSGGPLVSNGILIGIVSWGNGCARRDFPGVYTRTAAYRDWIRANTGI